ncbi:sulfonate ABC transporter substrate-binding protein [Paracidovorax avenae]|uniref:sulfonate ABC transporter substrate-binding protein n=1 Tax=Paracidovorax TaxID=3051137 RepID=UPI00047B57CF|nr:MULTISPECIES: sulfonate ABC transporter substrate-binding protein [Paracidovorax]AVS91018.1 sulfonate ABC transporter substrate-binding protein [Paracidovorax avenae]AVS98953.1 sulfonate ABC transporter substrate-binding protein [Paracidovorax avenae]AVT20381.1 sulfonate ABC transporter substrate-binding protein [Paracidovorax avenae]
MVPLFESPARTAPSTSRRRWLAAGAGAAALAALPAWSQSAGAARTLRIGHQKGWLSLLKARGTLEKRLAAAGVKVTWTEFNAGPVQLEALNVGSIDFGDVGEAPPIFAQAAGAPLVYAGATVPRPALEAVVVPKGSAIRSVADLKGKRVAYNKGSNVHYFLAKLLEKNGLQYRDVQSVFLAPPDARAAFERGAVDAWVIWDPFLAAAQKALDARILADATGVVNNRAFYFTSRDFAARNADVLRIAIEEVDGIDQWVAGHKAEAAVELSQVLGLDRAVTELFVGRVGYGTRAVTREILAEQQAIADTFFALKLIPKKLDVLQAAPVELL